MKWLVVVVVALAGGAGCKGKSNKDEPAPAKPSAKVGAATARACLEALERGDAVTACRPLCADIGAYKPGKPGQRRVQAKQLNIAEGLLTRRSYVVLRAGQCLAAWHTTATDADKQAVAKLEAVVKLPLAARVQGYYELPDATKVEPPPPGTAYVIVTPGQVNAMSQVEVKVSVKRTQVSGSFPGDAVALNELGTAVQKLGAKSLIVVADKGLSLSRLAAVVHGLGTAAHLAARRGDAAGMFQGQAGPVDDKKPGLLTWKQLIASKKRPLPIRLRVTGETVTVGDVIARVDPIQPVPSVWLAPPAATSRPPVGEARMALEVVKATGAKPAAIKQRVSTMLGPLQQCYASQLAAKPLIKGAVVARVAGDRAGVVSSSRAKGVDKSVSRCVAMTLKKVRFGQQAAAGFSFTLQVSYTTAPKSPK